MDYLDNNSSLEIQDLSAIDYQKDEILWKDSFEENKSISLNETQPKYNAIFISKNLLPPKIKSENDQNIIAQNSKNKSNKITPKNYFFLQ